MENKLKKDFAITSFLAIGIIIAVILFVNMIKVAVYSAEQLNKISVTGSRFYEDHLKRLKIDFEIVNNTDYPISIGYYKFYYKILFPDGKVQTDSIKKIFFTYKIENNSSSIYTVELKYNDYGQKPLEIELIGDIACETDKSISKYKVKFSINTTLSFEE